MCGGLHPDLWLRKAPKNLLFSGNHRVCHNLKVCHTYKGITIMKVCLCHTYAGMSYFCSYVMLMQVRHTYQGNIVVRMYLCLWRYLIWISYLVGRYFVKVTEKRSPDDLGMKSGMHLGRSGERATQSSCYCRLLLPRPLLRLD